MADVFTIPLIYFMITTEEMTRVSSPWPSHFVDMIP